MATAIIKAKGFESPDGYEDKYVSRGKIAFSFLSEKNEMVGPFVDCRGYLIERLQGFLLGKTNTGSSQYKYADGVMGEVCLDKTRLVISRKGTSLESFESELELIVNLLNKIEKDLGLVRSKYSRVGGIDKNYGHSFLIEGSKRWMLSPVMLSLYTVLIRNGYRHKKTQSYLTTLKSFDTGTDGAAKNLVPGVEYIVKNKYWKVFGKDIKANYTAKQVAYMHQTGIQIFSMGTLAAIKMYMELWPHWLWPGADKKVIAKAA